MITFKFETMKSPKMIATTRRATKVDKVTNKVITVRPKDKNGKRIRTIKK